MMLKSFILFWIFILAIFTPFLLISGRPAPLGYGVLFLLSLGGLFKLIVKKAFTDFQILLGIFILFACYSLVIFFVHNLFNSSNDPRGFLGSIVAIVVLLAAVNIEDILRRLYGKDSVEKFIRILLVLSVLNCIFVFLTFESEAFKIFFYNVVSVNPKMFEYPIPRYSGLSYDGFSYASTLNALIILIIYFYLTEYKVAKLTKILGIISILIIFSATVLVGRTGVGLVLIGFVLFILIDFLFKGFWRSLLSFVKTFKWILLVLIITLTGVVNYFAESNIIDYFNYGFQVFNILFTEGSLQDDSVDDIMNSHYFLPDGIVSVLIGTGNFGRGASYLPSDLGVILGLFGFGVIGLSFYLILNLGVFIAAIRFTKSFRIQLKLFILLMILFAINFKDYYIFYPAGHYFLIFFILIQHLQARKAERIPQV